MFDVTAAERFCMDTIKRHLIRNVGCEVGAVVDTNGQDQFDCTTGKTSATIVLSPN